MSNPERPSYAASSETLLTPEQKAEHIKNVESTFSALLNNPFKSLVLGIVASEPDKTWGFWEIAQTIASNDTSDSAKSLDEIYGEVRFLEKQTFASSELTNVETTNGGSRGVRLTEKGVAYGVPVAQALLAWQASHETVTSQALFGTLPKDADQTATDTRTLRLEIFDAAINGSGAVTHAPTHAAKTQFRKSLASLNDAGVLSTEKKDVEQEIHIDNSVTTFNPETGSKSPEETAITATAKRILRSNTLFPNPVLPPDIVHAERFMSELKKRHPDIDENRVRQLLEGSSHPSSDLGVNLKEGRGMGIKAEHITLNPELIEPISDLLSVVDAFKSSDQTAIANLANRGNQVTKEPALLSKILKSSRQYKETRDISSETLTEVIARNTPSTGIDAKTLHQSIVAQGHPVSYKVLQKHLESASDINVDNEGRVSVSTYPEGVAPPTTERLAQVSTAQKGLGLKAILHAQPPSGAAAAAKRETEYYVRTRPSLDAIPKGSFAHIDAVNEFFSLTLNNAPEMFKIGEHVVGLLDKQEQLSNHATTQVLREAAITGALLDWQQKNSHLPIEALFGRGSLHGRRGDYAPPPDDQLDNRNLRLAVLELIASGEKLSQTAMIERLDHPRPRIRRIIESLKESGIVDHNIDTNNDQKVIRFDSSILEVFATGTTGFSKERLLTTEMAQMAALRGKFTLTKEEFMSRVQTMDPEINAEKLWEKATTRKGDWTGISVDNFIRRPPSQLTIKPGFAGAVDDLLETVARLRSGDPEYLKNATERLKALLGDEASAAQLKALIDSHANVTKLSEKEWAEIIAYNTNPYNDDPQALHESIVADGYPIDFQTLQKKLDDLKKKREKDSQPEPPRPEPTSPQPHTPTETEIGSGDSFVMQLKQELGHISEKLSEEKGTMLHLQVARASLEEAVSALRQAQGDSSNDEIQQAYAQLSAVLQDIETTEAKIKSSHSSVTGYRAWL